MKVYLVYDITDEEEHLELFKKEKDAENYIQEKAKEALVNMENVLKFSTEYRDFNDKLSLDVLYRNEDDPNYEVYERFFVVEREVK